MPTIRPSADLRNNYNEISELCHEYAEPVFITKNGTGDLAVMSIETYELLAGKLELYSLINEGLEQTKDGKTKPMKESINLMNKPRIYVDFNEMIDENIVLLSVNDSKMDSEGNVIQFCEGLPVYIYSNDIDENGNEDNLIANGFATKYDLSKDKHWSHVKWCCKIDLDGIIHESDLKKNDGVRANDT